jgi:hypothetical protein
LKTSIDDLLAERWSRAELDGRTMSFLASVFSAAGVVLDDA